MDKSQFFHKGEIWCSDQHDIAVLRIPKNASTTLCKVLGCTNRQVDFGGKRVITCIRNPLNRFISGIVQAMKRESHINVPKLFN